MSLTVTPVSGALGAVIEDADPRDPELDFDAVYQAMLDHEVVFFPEVGLSEAEHLAFGRRFGTPSVYPVARLMGATEPTMTVIEDGPDQPNVADVWHTDVTWTAEPPKCALLHMEVPAERGGDTLWASATRAYELFSPTMRRFLDGLTGVHDNEGFIRNLAVKTGDPEHELITGLRRDYLPVEHPLVRTHPETGKRALLYAGRFLRSITELGDDEGEAVLDLIARHVQNPALHCRWRWNAGDLAVWDERSTLHRAAADHWPQRRVIRRLEIDGDRPY